MKKVAVIGHTGMVGSQVYRWFKEQRGYEVYGLSKKSGNKNWNVINAEAKYIFIAVPTPFNWKKNKYDLSILKDVISNIESDKIVIIKSTVPPGTTERLQKQRGDLRLLFNPEFLSRSTAWEDFRNPDRQLVGYTKTSYPFAQEVLHLLPMSPYDAIMKAAEAEVCKYVNNFHGALMVIFANFFYDICKDLKIDYETVKKASIAAKWVGSPMGRMYWDVFQGKARGYGGGCFPKDMNTLLEWCKKHHIHSEILEATQEANQRLLKSQGLTEKEAERKL